MSEKYSIFEDNKYKLAIPARKNLILVDGNFTTGNRDFVLTDSNKFLVCQNSTSCTLTLSNLAWLDSTEIEIFRYDAAIEILTSGGISLLNPNTSTNLDANSSCILKRINATEWFIDGRFS